MSSDHYKPEPTIVHNAPFHHTFTSYEPVTPNIPTTDNNLLSINGPGKTKDKAQQSITKGISHRPFIAQDSFQQPVNKYSPISPHQDYKDHLLLFGTPLPIIDHTRILRVCTQNTQNSFNQYGDGLKFNQLLTIYMK